MECIPSSCIPLAVPLLIPILDLSSIPICLILDISKFHFDQNDSLGVRYLSILWNQYSIIWIEIRSGEADSRVSDSARRLICSRQRAAGHKSEKVIAIYMLNIRYRDPEFVVDLFIRRESIPAPSAPPAGPRPAPRGRRDKNGDLRVGRGPRTPSSAATAGPPLTDETSQVKNSHVEVRLEAATFWAEVDALNR
ncbi:hypothetical protein EVAR_11581_1 [Eumeta japonica]|uniref:Uncharacterized protein n=1 Tax=Eumeta variegata TaxID=151549 RepID=A0A4C1X3L6_EUMVA|nr:hypothetical protein EVAR_11581_1 [Eumeta japonica]